MKGHHIFKTEKWVVDAQQTKGEKQLGSMHLSVPGCRLVPFRWLHDHAMKSQSAEYQSQEL